jgi:hypothetical protein
MALLNTIRSRPLIWPPAPNTALSIPAGFGNIYKDGRSAIPGDPSLNAKSEKEPTTPPAWKKVCAYLATYTKICKGRKHISGAGRSNCSTLYGCSLVCESGQLPSHYVRQLYRQQCERRICLRAGGTLLHQGPLRVLAKPMRSLVPATTSKRFGGGKCSKL